MEESGSSWRSVWLKPLVATFLKGNKTQMTAISTYVLPKLLKTDPYSVPYIIELMPPEPDSSTDVEGEPPVHTRANS
ncbi:tRNA (32-2'-O)-methyltransferase regulator THADA-like isoform X2 [Tachypleus tridentatus]|uniref:tRNA (32-2'-O)-methyltransferase regulator THADA-like isoform X2 n=1 Tax=Tachypleus tridentatus TaxID=6853 RepID=UPI003FD1FFBC